jgi:PPOX class probable F420-dependent enzyme
MDQYMGRGVNQRKQIVMTPSEIDAFIHEKHPMTMCTIGLDGNIHAVGMWYGFLEGAMAVESKAKAQKVVNVRRDPRVTCLVQTGESYEELRGVSIIGRAEVVEEPDRIWAIGVSVVDRYYGPYTDALKPAVEAMIHKRVGIKVNPIRVISWDHRKLALPASRQAEDKG